MATVSLKKLLGKKSPLAKILAELVKGTQAEISLLDANGELLLGGPPKPADIPYPVLQDNLEIGRVLGGQSASSLAALLTYLVTQEAEKKSLVAEVLDRYRELNLLYTLSSKLAANPQPDAIAMTTLDEATHLIRARFGAIVLNTEGQDGYRPVATYGEACQLEPGSGVPGKFLQRVMQSGKEEILNDIPEQDCFGEAGDGLISLIAAPLKTEKNRLGAIILASQRICQYTAGDLKLLNTIAQQAAPAIEIAHLYQIAIEKARLEHELQMAHKVQMGLLPKAMPDIKGWAFSAIWCPARGVSGDFYDLIPEKDGRLGLVIADVTDKSLPAALFMAFTRSVLRASVERHTTPVDGLTRANQLVCLESHQGLFVTLFYAQLDVDTGLITYVNAGHNPPLHYRSHLGRLDSLTLTGLPLGIEVDAAYQQNTVQMDRGDFILFYTDGITEAFNPSEEQFSEERLKEVLLANRKASAEQLVLTVQDRVAAFISGMEASDDITLLAVRRL